jgi:Leucine-rich repeat (LRR) protein
LLCLVCVFVCRLRILDLEENYLETIPNEVGRLKELSRLILQSNVLTQLPRAIGQLVTFSVLGDLNPDQCMLLGLPDPLVRGTDPAPVLDSSLFS